ncbi:hypothetical protein LTR99_005834 [Exophiala xenobiotica]|uniref:Beta-lactamase-related domain-containing protein n=1 Tax=Vermiconidia calcicola TaxID=1690605 RepID=A0AAV9QD46_9PEZI|nr:hypothetical protein LTR92_006276 [Exophiala xenobiotica]KAK5541092.1 hypothetical protein LTR25_002869 [Vermiconidia calcicola]KAK5549415.1 hypothetical protein LTR23_000523 [Chaetothyriales sp. CCFEE 6169]KAK5270452.1 hypothetical protein LTR96_004953 [Exophiala xenobiotica]KAK5302877.1 hypothetical protein LTR99_005834 [Exophiala xenobiotica]
MESKLTPLFEDIVKQKKTPGIGAMLVNSEGDFLLKQTYGTTNLDDPSAAPFTADTTMQIFSCTKLITSIAALQLIEQGKLSLSDPVEKYIPRISKIQVLESFSSSPSGASASATSTSGQAEPALRAPKSKPTILQLLTHTTGFSYDFFDPLTCQYRSHTGRKPGGYSDPSDWADFETPFIADPGTKYIYGVNTDWLGAVVQQISGTKLPEYIDQHILAPLGMNDTGAYLDRLNKSKLAVHFTTEEGKLVAVPTFRTNEDPALFGGGAYLYSTMNDYAKLLATLLNKGTSPVTGKAILKPDTVKEFLFTDHLSPEVDRSLLGESGDAIPLVSSPGCFLPGLPHSKRGWSCGLLLNLEDLPYGRRRGSGGWAGLGNLYYWIDLESDVAGMVCTGVLPFFNKDVLKLFDQVERVAYGHEPATTAGSGEEAEGMMNHRAGPPPEESAMIGTSSTAKI